MSTQIRIGIGMRRWHDLRCIDDDFKQWSEGIMPAVAHCYRLGALDESLTTWRGEHGYAKWLWKPLLPFDELPTYHKITHTPPARPEWLEALT